MRGVMSFDKRNSKTLIFRIGMNLEVQSYPSAFQAILLLSAGANYLLIKIFQRIQNLFLWKSEDPKNNPSKMLTVNCLLSMTILCKNQNYTKVKLFSCYYSIAGFFFSQFWKWDCETKIESLTLSPSFYIIIQICQAQTLNLTFCFCSNLWLKLWRMKLRIEQNNSLLSLTKILQLFLSTLIVIIPILTITSLILESYVNNIREYCLGALTMLSTVSFAFICIILYSKLKDQYSVGDHYRANLKFLSVAVIICTLFRPSFNFLFSQEFFWRLKPGLECEAEDGTIITKLPDTGFTWAIFQLIYSCITDFIPIYILSLLFSPNVTKRKTLVNVSDGWDTGLE
ncbi:unnamed protein product (macronuclear) [Paramecium tetraurelia]|uniref:Serpentine receptor class gamma n=1 Tax=Paramecium tetraurelia TaxID=5888 RepID=A0ECI8_PARTE|nr:uncharacterized protein GSPATT00003874001 [Paramecium tetraurelia]CAK93005.1 unnamed protein product [Paramecium tetraurelia]|eukprot:XP_001460402.1 hypothetical protein (macronuclear) [Paramecium tetraurelia strain d4-2]